MSEDQSTESTPPIPERDSVFKQPILNLGQVLADQIAKSIHLPPVEFNVLPTIELMKMEALNDVFEDISQTIQSSISAHVEELNRRLSKIWEPFEKWMEEQKIPAKEIGPCFEEAGLWLSPSMPISIWFEVRKLHAGGQLTSTVLQQLVIDMFHKNDHELLRDMVNNWWDCSNFKRRKRFIQDALDAHLSGKYTLSVPILLLSAEGITRDEYGAFHTRNLKEKFEDTEPNGPFRPVDIVAFASAFSRVYTSIGEKRSLEEFPEFLYRHAVLHGRDLDYDKPLNSLRALLILDQLHTFCMIDRIDEDEF